MAKVSHMVLPVSDLQQSRDWYADKLGFKVDHERDGDVGIKDQSGLVIFLQKATGPLAGQKITLTIQVDGADRKYAEPASLGVNCLGPPKLQFWGYGAEVLDPDGYMNHLGGLEADHGKIWAAISAALKWEGLRAQNLSSFHQVSNIFNIGFISCQSGPPPRLTI